MVVSKWRQMSRVVVRYCQRITCLRPFTQQELYAILWRNSWLLQRDEGLSVHIPFVPWSGSFSETAVPVFGMALVFHASGTHRFSTNHQNRPTHPSTHPPTPTHPPTHFLSRWPKKVTKLFVHSAWQPSPQKLTKVLTWIASCCFSLSTLPQKPATVTEKKSNLAI